MAQANAIYIRRAALVAMVGHAPLTAVIPAASLFGPQRPSNPARPWGGFDHVTEGEFAASCMAGTDHTVRVQLFFETTDTASGEELALGAAAIVKELFDGAAIDLAAHGSPGPAVAHFDWVSTQPLQGESADDWRAIVTLRVRVTG